MSMDPVLKANVEAWLSKRCPSFICPACFTGGKWIVNDPVYCHFDRRCASGDTELPETGDTELPELDEMDVACHIPVGCPNCGYLAFFSESVMYTVN
jgi:hypothetical protein